MDDALEKLADRLRSKRGFISDMDGVLYHGSRLLPGAKEFINWLKGEKK
ncbi:MAG: TIGR01457 family HAD-type hydrolase, partial [Alkalispirochaetaceae bacterium]